MPTRLAMTQRQAVTVAALVAYGWWATSLRPFSVAATVAVVGGGALAVGWGLLHRLPRRQQPRRPGVGGWAVLAAALAGWQVAAYLQHPRHEHPTLSSIINDALDLHPVRALTCAAWVATAAALARR